MTYSVLDLNQDEKENRAAMRARAIRDGAVPVQKKRDNGEQWNTHMRYLNCWQVSVPF